MSDDPMLKDRADNVPGRAVHEWWRRSLGGHPNHDNGATRAARARLRRAASPADVLSLGVTHDLYHAILNADGKRDLRHGEDGPVRLALIASVLAAIEVHDGRSHLARRFGPSGREEQPALSPLRFQRLLRAPDNWRLSVALRRALPLVGKTADVRALGADLLFWGDRIRNRWCFEYFGTAPPAQFAQTPTTDESENA